MVALLVSLMAMATHSDWVLTFHDEFDGAKGLPPSKALWGRNIGGDGWGNNELESYTDGNANAFLDGKGHLVIEARKETTTGPDHITRPYSSARLLSEGKFSQEYGRFEARMKLPQGKGVWPAFWLLGSNIGKVGWPQCGEIDILESVEKVARFAHGTLHGPGYSGASGISKQIESRTSLAEGFHVYSVEWEPKQIKWFLDGTCYSTVTPAQIRGQKWVFDQPFFITLNLAIGGYWPGYPDATTEFPQRLLVDYVRVYKRKGT